MKKSVFYWVMLCVTVLTSCGNKPHAANNDDESSETDSVERMSIEDAEAHMFVKQSEYNPSFSQSLSDNYQGEIFLQIQTLLNENSLVAVLSDIINEETGVQDKMYSLAVQEEPFDTLYLDDFEVVEGKIGFKQEIAKLIIYDQLWCTVLSDALFNVKKYESFVKTCQNNIKQHEKFFSRIETEINKYENQDIPHVPLILVHQFSQFLSIYSEQLGRNANYLFTGYSFQFTDDSKVQYIVEEFNF